MGKTLGTYDFPSRSALENYGEDMIVHIFIKGRSLMCSAAAVRVPRAMPWNEFVDTQVKPFIQADPWFDHSKEISYELVDQPFSPVGDASLTENGVAHKQTISVVTD